MDAFAVPLALFTAALVWLLVEIIRGSIDDPYPLRAGLTWAVTCPAAGLLFGIGLAPIAVVFATVSALALGSLCYWFMATEADDSDGEADAAADPDPGPTDDLAVELPGWAVRPEVDAWAQPRSDVDWDAFDRLREEWEREFTIPAPEPDRVAKPEREPALT
jgi:hypothetical protein